MRVMLSVETDHGVAIAYVQSPLVHSVPPVNDDRAVRSRGDAVLSERLTANPGLWTSPYGDTVTVNYYWSRCDADGNACDYLHTGRNHTVEADDLGVTSCKVMLSVETDHGVAIAYAQTPVVHSVPPVNVTAPSMAATRQGSKLTVNPGTWTNPYGDAVTVNYYWSRCDADGSSCDYLHTGRTHTLGRDDVGPRDEGDALGRDRPRRRHQVRAVGRRLLEAKTPRGGRSMPALSLAIWGLASIFRRRDQPASTLGTWQTSAPWRSSSCSASRCSSSAPSGFPRSAARSVRGCASSGIPSPGEQRARARAEVPPADPAPPRAVG